MACRKKLHPDKSYIIWSLDLKSEQDRMNLNFSKRWLFSRFSRELPTWKTRTRTVSSQFFLEKQLWKIFLLDFENVSSQI